MGLVDCDKCKAEKASEKANIFGCGVVQSQSYAAATAETVVGGYETGVSTTSVIAGDISNPVSLYAQNASEWWKITEYKVGVQVNIGNGGFSYSTNLLESSITVSSENTSLEIMSGINKVGFTVSQGVDFSLHTAETYHHGYIRTVPIAFAVALATVGIGYAGSFVLIPLLA